MLAELRSDGTVERANTWGLDLSGSEQGAGGVGGALLVSIPDAATRTATVPVYDGNGNITGLLNASTGVTEALYEYGPFGETLRETGRLASANVLRWSTKREDSAVGLVHYELRDYTARTGRWTKRDPIGEGGGVNPYMFSNDDPLNGIDFLGLDPAWAISNMRQLASDWRSKGWTFAANLLTHFYAGRGPAPYIPTASDIEAIRSDSTYRTSARSHFKAEANRRIHARQFGTFRAPRCSVWETENGVDELEPDSVGEQLTLARGLKIPLKKERYGSQRII